MAPSNGTNTASFPAASTSSPSTRPAQVIQGSFPVASIIMLAISIIGMGALVVFVFLQHSRSSARIKQSSSTAHKDKTSPIDKHWPRVLSWFSKMHLWLPQTKSATKHKQGDMTTVGASHATCTFVAAAPSKFLTPPVVTQFRISDTDKFVVLCSVCCPLSAHHTCGDPKLTVQSTFVDTPHLAHHSEQLPVNNPPSSILEREPHSVDIPLSDQGHSRTIEPSDLSPANQPQSSSIPPTWPKRTLAREDLPVLCVKPTSR